MFGILQDMGWDTLDQRRFKQLARSFFKSLNNLYPESLKNVLNFNVRGSFHEVPRTLLFLYQGPVLKLLSGLLAFGVSHVEWPRKCA